MATRPATTTAATTTSQSSGETPPSAGGRKLSSGARRMRSRSMFDRLFSSTNGLELDDDSDHSDTEGGAPSPTASSRIDPSDTDDDDSDLRSTDDSSSSSVFSRWFRSWTTTKDSTGSATGSDTPVVQGAKFGIRTSLSSGDLKATVAESPSTPVVPIRASAPRPTPERNHLHQQQHHSNVHPAASAPVLTPRANVTSMTNSSLSTSPTSTSMHTTSLASAKVPDDSGRLQLTATVGGRVLQLNINAQPQSLEIGGAGANLIDLVRTYAARMQDSTTAPCGSAEPPISPLHRRCHSSGDSTPSVSVFAPSTPLNASYSNLASSSSSANVSAAAAIEQVFHIVSDNELDDLQAVLSESDSWTREVTELTITSFRPHKLALETIPLQVCWLRALQRLVLKQHKIKQLPPSIASLSRLSELTVSHCGLTTLPKDDLASLHSLRYLDLSHNRLSGLPRSIGQLLRLEHLNVSHNELISLGDVGKLSQLRVLLCAYNLIAGIPQDLQALTSLQVLDVKSNLLLNSGNSLIAKMISGASAVSEMVSLVHLDLSLNKMSVAPSLAKLTRLVSCNLSKNVLTEFPQGAASLGSLEVLDLSDNQIPSIPLLDIEGMSKLQRLNMQHNQLRYISASIHHLQSLQQFVASHNQLQVVPACLGYMPSLTLLDLESNCIDTIENQAFSTALERLTLKHNQLVHVPPLDRLPHLSVLDLSFNRIEELPALPPNLKDLRVSHNALTTLPENLASPELRLLELHANPISTLPPSVTALANLSYISILNIDIQASNQATTTDNKLIDVSVRVINRELVAPQESLVADMLRLARSCPHRLFVSAILNLTESTYQLQFKSSIGDMLSLITQQYETAEPAIPALATLCNNAELRQELCDLHIPRLMLETLTSEKASDELKKHCLEFFARLAYDPAFRVLVLQEIGASEFLRLERLSSNQELAGLARRILAILGVVEHLDSRIECMPNNDGSKRGLRLLAMDGGGARAVVSLQVLKRLEAETGKKTCELFDVIGGTSTGGVLAALLGVKCLRAVEVEKLYHRFISRVFSATPTTNEDQPPPPSWTEGWRGLTNMLSTGARYHTPGFEERLREIVSTDRLIDTASCFQTPKVLLTSANMSFIPPVPYLFRNYEYAPGSESRYQGTSSRCTWEGIRATSAAPSLFEEAVYDSLRFQDGGIVCNNPAAIVLHEATRIWPNRKVDCLVSLGTGSHPPKPKQGGFKDTIIQFIRSACDVDRIDEVLTDLMPRDTYYRFCPEGPEYDCQLNDASEEKLILMAITTELWLNTAEQSARVAKLVAMMRPPPSETPAQTVPPTITTATDETASERSRVGDQDISLSGSS